MAVADQCKCYKKQLFVVGLLCLSNPGMLGWLGVVTVEKRALRVRLPLCKVW